MERIEKVFIEMLQRKKLSEISVSDICKLAGLNRTTFYANYTDIYGLADAIRKEPDAAHADRRTDAAHDKTKTAAEGVAGRIVVSQVMSPLFFCLIFCCRQEPCAS